MYEGKENKRKIGKTPEVGWAKSIQHNMIYYDGLSTYFEPRDYCRSVGFTATATAVHRSHPSRLWTLISFSSTYFISILPLIRSRVGSMWDDPSACNYSLFVSFIFRLYFVLVRFVSNGRRIDSYIYVHFNLLTVHIIMWRLMVLNEIRMHEKDLPEKNWKDAFAQASRRSNCLFHLRRQKTDELRNLFGHLLMFRVVYKPIDAAK